MNTIESYMRPTLLCLPQLVEYTGLSRSTIYDLMNPKSPNYDPSFPKRFHLTKTAVRWVEADVYAWIELQIQNREQRSIDASLKAKSKKRKTHLTSNNSSQHVV